MLWRSLNFWRIAAIILFILVLILAFPLLKPGPRFKLQSSAMNIQKTGTMYGANFHYSVKNTGGLGGEVNVNFHAYLNDRGGESQFDYITIGINAGETKSGQFFMPLVPGQAVHDWRIDLS